MSHAKTIIERTTKTPSISSDDNADEAVVVVGKEEEGDPALEPIEAVVTSKQSATSETPLPPDGNEAVNPGEVVALAMTSLEPLLSLENLYNVNQNGGGTEAGGQGRNRRRPPPVCTYCNVEHQV